ncbi:MAG: hypothetical protein GXX90_02695, partial [Microbacteriaceae bacterium]|nr:hypothetical protein [Microbacteriaceae bacterium]
MSTAVDSRRIHEANRSREPEQVGYRLMVKARATPADVASAIGAVDEWVAEKGFIGCRVLEHPDRLLRATGARNAVLRAIGFDWIEGRRISHWRIKEHWAKPDYALATTGIGITAITLIDDQMLGRLHLLVESRPPSLTVLDRAGSPTKSMLQIVDPPRIVGRLLDDLEFADGAAP